MDDNNEGKPKTGFVGETTGLEERVRAARRSGSLAVGGVGIGEARALCVESSGVARAEEEPRWATLDVSMRRMGGGLCKCRMANEDMNTCWIEMFICLMFSYTPKYQTKRRTNISTTSDIEQYMRVRYDEG